MLRARGDDGQLTLLVIGYTFIAATLIVIGVDASKVFLARRALSATADSAALSAAQAVDRRAIYAGRAGGCGGALPIDPAAADQAEVQSYEDDASSLRSTFARLDPAVTTVDTGTVTVRLAGDVHVPFGGVLETLLGHSPDVHVTATSSATSPVQC